MPEGIMQMISLREIRKCAISGGGTKELPYTLTRGTVGKIGFRAVEGAGPYGIIGSAVDIAGVAFLPSGGGGTRPLPE